ncbi:50S ribosomal protein L14e [Metallosphaera javensis (ex Sakai et al. 2022)]|uniref:50S ribosomal protein L14e n=1 Tax=Metallosphaera javensis (ex Sakai et al. 2022) TaxID=2775498 RepID=UPI002589C1BC|nr:MAG: 50S ribosomal protein L14e [Metallosphaera javensis (ex Sakai et al. 2022)]
MAIIEVGRICVKLSGREAGSKCVIVDIIDNNFVLVTGPKNISGVKRRRVNISHLEPTDKAVEIAKGASDQEIEAKLKEQGLIDFMKEKVKVKVPVI